ncbi:MAG: DUF1460 domain-containing protein [Longimicrobiales bacterium]|nr:DUF1460 domain-containing protein [Longimicrobiales bacterium]
MRRSSTSTVARWAVSLALAAAGPVRASDRDVSAARWPDADWAAFHERIQWALERDLANAPMGEAMAALGRTFVGTAYVPRTLDPEGPEALVIDFQGLDCVTFVENALALALFVREPDAAVLLDRRDDAEARYEELLTRIRYRGGRLEGYASRLHYFSDWIADGEAKGLVADVTREMGGALDTDAVDFMTTHPAAYRQLAEDPWTAASVRADEERLTAAGRWVIPEAGLEQAATAIRDGDIIAATSTARGLDVAHTGIALWVDGTLRLLHAPLVGDSVQISDEPLPGRIRRISGQDGIMVARPLERAP